MSWSKLWNFQTITLFIFSDLCSLLGNLFLKFGVVQLSLFELEAPVKMLVRFWSLLGNIYVIMGFLFVFISTLLWLVLLTKVELSVLYPLVSINYITVVLTSKLFFHEPVSLVRWLGVVCIGIGVSIVVKSSMVIQYDPSEK